MTTMPCPRTALAVDARPDATTHRPEPCCERCAISVGSSQDKSESSAIWICSAQRLLVCIHGVAFSPVQRRGRCRRRRSPRAAPVLAGRRGRGGRSRPAFSAGEDRMTPVLRARTDFEVGAGPVATTHRPEPAASAARSTSGDRRTTTSAPRSGLPSGARYDPPRAAHRVPSRRSSFALLPAVTARGARVLLAPPSTCPS